MTSSSIGVERRCRAASSTSAGSGGWANRGAVQTEQRPQSRAIGVVELLLQDAHQAAAVGAERGHRVLLGTTQGGDLRVALGVVGPVRVRDPTASACRPRRTAPSTSRIFSIASIRPIPRFTTAISSRVVRPVLAGRLELLEHRRHALAGGKRLLDEEVLDAPVLAAAQQDDVGVVDAAPGAPDLLVVGDDRARRLVVHDESQVGLVVAHPERAGRDHGLDLVAQQPLLGRDPSLGLLLAAVRHRRDPVGGQERRDLLGVALGQRVDDP